MKLFENKNIAIIILFIIVIVVGYIINERELKTKALAEQNQKQTAEIVTQIILQGKAQTREVIDAMNEDKLMEFIQKKAKEN